VNKLHLGGGDTAGRCGVCEASDGDPVSQSNWANPTDRRRRRRGGVPRRQRPLPGGDLGVVVHVVDPAVRQHPLLPAAERRPFSVNTRLETRHSSTYVPITSFNAFNAVTDNELYIHVSSD